MPAYGASKQRHLLLRGLVFLFDVTHRQKNSMIIRNLPRRLTKAVHEPGTRFLRRFFSKGPSPRHQRRALVKSKPTKGLRSYYLVEHLDLLCSAIFLPKSDVALIGRCLYRVRCPMRLLVVMFRMVWDRNCLLVSCMRPVRALVWDRAASQKPPIQEPTSIQPKRMPPADQRTSQIWGLQTRATPAMPFPACRPFPCNPDHCRSAL